MWDRNKTGHITYLDGIHSIIFNIGLWLDGLWGKEPPFKTERWPDAPRYKVADKHL